MTKTVGWLLRRVGMTLLFLYMANLVVMIAVALTLGFTRGFHSRIPAWMAAWTIYGELIPLGLALLVGASWGVARLVRYWREP